MTVRYCQFAKYMPVFELSILPLAEMRQNKGIGSDGLVLN